MFMKWIDRQPRRLLALLCITGVVMLGYGMYLQHVVGLNPCPMCIVQRYALILVALCAGLASASARRGWQMTWVAAMLLMALGGAFTAARQSWLQWYPPEVASCGRDFYGMVETFPLKRLLPMLFAGSGDCAAVDWTFLGGSLANWSFLSFSGFAVLALLLLLRRQRR